MCNDLWAQPRVARRMLALTDRADALGPLPQPVGRFWAELGTICANEGDAKVRLHLRLREWAGRSGQRRTYHSII